MGVEERALAAASSVDPSFVVGLARELVRIPSVYDPDEEGACEEGVALRLAEVLEGLGLEVKVDYVDMGRPNVVGLWGEGDRTILLEGHTDVVTPGDPSSWSVDPFGGEVRDGKLFGRGACDTKGNLAAAVAAVKALAELPGGLRGRVVLCAPVDEEGLMLGIKHFIKRGLAEGVDGAIICEPEDMRLCTSQKGALRAWVRLRGRMAHGAMPLSGINPAWALGDLILGLEGLEREERAMGEDPLLGPPSVTPTVIRAPSVGPGQINVIPSEASVGLDVRTIPVQEHGALKAKVEGLVREVAERRGLTGFEVDFFEERPCTRTDHDDPIVRASVRAYRLLFGEEPTFDGVPGATDGTFLWAWAGVPIVTTGAGRRDVPHQVDEHVEVEQLLAAARFYAACSVIFLEERW